MSLLFKVTKPRYKYQDGKFVTGKCPKCKSCIIFWNAKKKQEHLCTVCNKMVILPMELVLS